MNLNMIASEVAERIVDEMKDEVLKQLMDNERFMDKVIHLLQQKFLRDKEALAERMIDYHLNDIEEDTADLLFEDDDFEDELLGCLTKLMAFEQSDLERVI